MLHMKHSTDMFVGVFLCVCGAMPSNCGPTAHIAAVNVTAIAAAVEIRQYMIHTRTHTGSVKGGGGVCQTRFLIIIWLVPDITH